MSGQKGDESRGMRNQSMITSGNITMLTFDVNNSALLCFTSLQTNYIITIVHHSLDGGLLCPIIASTAELVTYYGIWDIYLYFT